jgi:hypothetical protein
MNVMSPINFFKKILLGIVIVFNFNACQKGPNCPESPTVISQYITQYKQEIIPFSSNYKQRYRDMKTGEVSLFTVQSLQDTILSMIINVQDDDCPRDFRYEMNSVKLIDSMGANVIIISHYPQNESTNSIVEFKIKNRLCFQASALSYIEKAKSQIKINGIVFDSVSVNIYDSSFYLMFKPNFGIIRIVTPEKALEIYE